MELCFEPFEIRDGLRASLESPPATLLVLPNGWVKVAAALPQICADLRHDRLDDAWNAYRAAWRSDKVLSAARRVVEDQAMLADANGWQALRSPPDRDHHGGSMSEAKQTIEPAKGMPQPKTVAPAPLDKPVWETPKLEDVSEQVMAQPYIRFT